MRLVQTVQRVSIESKLSSAPVHTLVVFDPFLLIVVAGGVLSLRGQ